jgi:hypothetical protein
MELYFNRFQGIPLCRVHRTLYMRKVYTFKSYLASLDGSTYLREPLWNAGLCCHNMRVTMNINMSDVLGAS